MSKARYLIESFKEQHGLSEVGNNKKKFTDALLKEKLQKVFYKLSRGKDDYFDIVIENESDYGYELGRIGSSKSKPKYFRFEFSLENNNEIWITVYWGKSLGSEENQDGATTNLKNFKKDAFKFINGFANFYSNGSFL
jgi:hypothetical protein